MRKANAWEHKEAQYTKQIYKPAKRVEWENWRPTKFFGVENLILKFKFLLIERIYSYKFHIYAYIDFLPLPCSFYIQQKKFSTFYSLHFQWWIFLLFLYMDHWPQVIIFWPWISRRKNKTLPIFSHSYSILSSSSEKDLFFYLNNFSMLKTFSCSFSSYNESINHFFMEILVCW